MSARVDGGAPQVAGPRHAMLSEIVSALDRAPAVQKLSTMQPPVQRIIRSTPPAPDGQFFEVSGRAGPHNTAANRDSLAELRLDRHQNPDLQAGHVNNEREEDVVTNQGNNPTGTGLHMAHNVSDSVVQHAITTAANTYNQSTQQDLTAWDEVQGMINGIEPPLATTATTPAFRQHALASHSTASQTLQALMAVHPIPHTTAMEGMLTMLASAIANSPMNLHLGDGPTNMSLGHHNDPNSHPAPLGRSLTWRSHQMRQALALTGFNPAHHDRTHAMALALPPNTLAHQQAMLNPGIPPNSIHNSASMFLF